MSDVARKRYVSRFVLPLLGAIILVWFVSCDPSTHTAGDGDRPASPGDASASFGIDGNATEPVSPGVKVPLDLEFTNPHNFPISVTGLRAIVHSVNAPNADDTHPCAVVDFAVDQVSSALQIRLAARVTSTLSSLDLARAQWPRVGMLDRTVNQDGCKGASLILTYSASGVIEK